MAADALARVRVMLGAGVLGAGGGAGLDVRAVGYRIRGVMANFDGVRTWKLTRTSPS